MCLYPTIARNRRYTETKKNGGVIPPFKDHRVLSVPIGCGDCMECRKQKARSWQLRLTEDIKEHKNGKFITLTFSNESIRKICKDIKAYNEFNNLPDLEGYDLDNQIATWAVRLFLERWRKKFGKSVRHWLITELGHNGTENIHLHGILFTNESGQTIKDIWNYGYVWAGNTVNGRLENYVNEKTVNYITKYVTKIDAHHKGYKARILTSKGIGRSYITNPNARKNTYKPEGTNETYRTSTGHKMSLPIYWRNKIYTDDQREDLWIQRLDKNERWVCGERVDISKTEKEYFKLLKWHQARNKQLGYGNGKLDWTRRKYEQERRAIMHAKRLNPEMS